MSEDLRARNVSRDNPNRRRAICERANECGVKFHKRVWRDRLAGMHYTERNRGMPRFRAWIKGGQYERHNLFRAAFNCRVKQRLRMMYVRGANVHVLSFRPFRMHFSRSAIQARGEMIPHRIRSR